MLLLFSAGLISQLCNAQSEASIQPTRKFSIAFDAGTTYSRIKSITAAGVETVNLPDDHQKFALGYSVGIAGVYKLTDRLSASLALNYQTQKIRYTQETGYFLPYDMPAINSHSEIAFASHTLSIPLEAQFQLTSTPSAPFVGIGGVASYYLGTKESYSVFADSDDAELTSGTAKGRSDNYTPWNFHLRVAAGYHIELNVKWSADISASYNFGLTKILTEDVLFDVNHKLSYAMLRIRIGRTF